MKRMLIKGLLVAGALMLAAAPAIAEDCKDAWKTGEGTFISDTGGGGQINLTLSPNVYIFYKADGATGLSYAAASYNSKGTKLYGVASDYQGIYYYDDEANIKAGTVAALTIASAGAFDGWNEVGK